MPVEFNRIFSQKTGYDDLDDRIEKTRSKKDALLMVLKHPELPLHNNASELGAMVEKRRQDVSVQTKSKEGTKTKDSFLTITQTQWCPVRFLHMTIFSLINRLENIQISQSIERERKISEIQR